jgi:hypothetical protein
MLVLLLTACVPEKTGIPLEEDSAVDTGSANPPDDGDPTPPDDGDCSDSDTAIHPGAVEICDGIDNDCDGEIDEGVIATFHPDGDGDGYGDPGASEDACEPETGWVPDATDCDDTDADVHPGAPEACNGRDDDCDPATGCARWSGEIEDEDADAIVRGVGGEWVALGDLDGDGAIDLASGLAGTDAGESWVFGRLGAGEHSSTEAVATITGAASEQLGGAGGIPGDVTGDGVDDLVLVGANGGIVMAGPLVGSRTGADAWATFDWASAIWRGPDHAFAGIDADGDGATDLVVGDPHGSPDAGAVTIFRGPLPAAALVTDEARIEVGADVANAGDTDGDGFDDLWVAAPGTTVAGDWPGAAALFRGPIAGTLTLADADALVYATDGEIGSHVAGSGDTDGDGYGDLLTAGSNIAFLLTGPIAGTRTGSDAIATLTGCGHGAVALGDLDDDGRADLVLGAPSDSRISSAYLYYSPVVGALASADADVTLWGGGYYDRFGAAFAIGDVDGDGGADLVVSDPDIGGPGADVFVFFPG